MAFEKFYGPLLVHDRVDWGLSALRPGEDGKLILPPWHQRGEQQDDGPLSTLERLAGAKQDPNEEIREPLREV